jgi:hypothetical protein
MGAANNRSSTYTPTKETFLQEPPHINVVQVKQQDKPLNAEGAKSNSLLNESFEDEDDVDERLNYLSNQSTTALRHNTLTINKTKSVFDSD